MTKQLTEAFAAQRAAFAVDRYPDLDSRMERVSGLRRMVIDRRDAFRAALAEDFGSHHPWLTDLMETGPVLGRCNYFLRASAQTGWRKSGLIWGRSMAHRTAKCCCCPKA